MLVRRLWLALLALALLVPGAAAAQDTSALRIAVVDLDLLVAQSSAGRALQTKLQNFEQEIKRRLAELEEERNRTRQLVTEGSNSLSEERLNELQKQYEDQTIEIQRYTKDKQREGQKMQQEGLRDIELKLEPVLDQVQGQGNYDLILNRALGVVVMASDRVDITPRVLELLEASLAGGQTGDSG